MPGLSQSSAVRSKLPWELLEEVPRLGTVTWLLALASLGLPGLGSFPGEFLVLLGTYQASPLAAAGLVPAAVYSLWLVQRVLQGPRPEERSHGDRPGDLSAREVA